MIVEQQETRRQVSIRSRIQHLEDWVTKLEARAEVLIDFDPRVMTESERENAAARILALVGKFIEVIHNFEGELLGQDDAPDSPKIVAAIIAGEHELPNVKRGF